MNQQISKFFVTLNIRNFVNCNNLGKVMVKFEFFDFE